MYCLFHHSWDILWFTMIYNVKLSIIAIMHGVVFCYECHYLSYSFFLILSCLSLVFILLRAVLCHLRHRLVLISQVLDLRQKWAVLLLQQKTEKRLQFVNLTRLTNTTCKYSEWYMLGNSCYWIRWLQCSLTWYKQ